MFTVEQQASPLGLVNRTQFPQYDLHFPKPNKHCLKKASSDSLNTFGTRNRDCRFGPPMFTLEGSKDAFVNEHFNHSVITLAG